MFKKLKRSLYNIVLESSQLFISVLAFVVGFNAFFINPDRAVYKLLPSWAFDMWAWSMMAGGVLIFLGIVALSREIERAGVAAIIGAATVYVIAMTTFHFFTIPDFSVWGALILSMLLRYWALGKDLPPFDSRW